MSDLITKILNEIMMRYPFLYKLIQYDFNTTMKLLIANKVLQYLNIDKMQATQIGYDNLKTWSDYKEKMKSYLFIILGNDDAFFKVKEDISYYIYNLYYNIFPSWPSPNQTQKSVLGLDTTGLYNKGIYTVVYHLMGHITVIDTRDSNTYKTEFKGEPNFKILKINNPKMLEFENLVRSDFQKAKNMIDSKRTNISWENFNN